MSDFDKYHSLFERARVETTAEAIAQIIRTWGDFPPEDQAEILANVPGVAEALEAGQEWLGLYEGGDYGPCENGQN